MISTVFHHSSKIWRDQYLVIVIIDVVYLVPFFILKETMLYAQIYKKSHLFKKRLQACVDKI